MALQSEIDRSPGFELNAQTQVTFPDPSVAESPYDFIMTFVPSSVDQSFTLAARIGQVDAPGRAVATTETPCKHVTREQGAGFVHVFTWIRRLRRGLYRLPSQRWRAWCRQDGCEQHDKTERRLGVYSFPVGTSSPERVRPRRASLQRSSSPGSPGETQAALLKTGGTSMRAGVRPEKQNGPSGAACFECVGSGGLLPIQAITLRRSIGAFDSIT